MEEECEECEEGAPAWMATFSDMATLLLTFFVLLLSFANMDIQNFKMALGSVKEAFGVNHKVKGDFEARSNSIVEFSDTPVTAINAQDRQEYNEVADLKRYIRMKKMQHRVEVMGTEVGIVLRVKDVALFDVASDELREDSKPVLELVNDLFGKSKSVLSIEGHTDNVPIARMRFPSNWELSAARSAAVLRHFVGAGLQKTRLSIAGYGDLRPIADNATDEGRAQNRRVEFVFRRDGGQKGRMFDLNKGASNAAEGDAAEGDTAEGDTAEDEEEEIAEADENANDEATVGDDDEAQKQPETVDEELPKSEEAQATPPAAAEKSEEAAAKP